VFKINQPHRKPIKPGNNEPARCGLSLLDLVN
jgi:hypothetical protein